MIVAINTHTCSLDAAACWPCLPDDYLSKLPSFMAASSGDDVVAQLGSLLGKEVARIRKTGETPPRISVIDIVQAVTGLSPSNSAVAFKRLQRDHPDVGGNCSMFKFQGERQRQTPVTDAKVEWGDELKRIP